MASLEAMVNLVTKGMSKDEIQDLMNLTEENPNFVLYWIEREYNSIRRQEREAKEAKRAKEAPHRPSDRVVMALGGVMSNGIRVKREGAFLR